MSQWQDEIRSRLYELRSGIRRYLVFEGIAVVSVLIAAWFWLTYLVDVGYFGSTRLELPKSFRTLCLVGGLGAIAATAIGWLFTRVLRPLRMESLALLLESRYPEFGGRLMSALHSHVPRGDAASMMVERNEQDAADRLRNTEVLDVLNPLPLRRWSMAAGAMLVSVFIFGATNTEAMSRWSDAYLKGEQGYWDPFRKTDLKLFLVRQPGDVEVEFIDGHAKHGRGAHLTLLAVVPDGREVPDRVTLSIRSTGVSADAISQDLPMTPAGDGRFRHTVLRVAEDVEITLTGGDYTTVRPYFVDVVDAPRIDSVVLDCTYPEYTGLNTEANRLIPVQSSLVELPFGTRFRLVANTNKPLDAVLLGGEDVVSSRVREAEVTVGEREWSLAGQAGGEDASDAVAFRSGRPLEITLRDTDGLVSLEPIELTFVARDDTAPVVTVQSRGIGNSVTRKARLPFEGTVVDDYALNEAWFDYGIVVRDKSTEAARLLLDEEVDGRREFELDPELSALDLRPLGLAVGQQIRVSIAASDTNDLTGPGLGRSDAKTLTIVSDEELLGLLYDKELNLRQRFEQILSEVVSTRDDIRLAGERARQAADADTNADASEQWNQISAATEQAVLAVRKNESETHSIILLFEDIRAELINNRVDTAEKLQRIDRGIVGPLQRVVAGQFPASEQSLIAVRATTRGEQDFPAAVQPLEAASNQLDDLVQRLQSVLNEMQQRQSFNEMIEIVSRLIEEQKKLKKRTEEKSVEDFLGDDFFK